MGNHVTRLDATQRLAADAANQRDAPVRTGGEQHHAIAQFHFQLIHAVAQGFGIQPVQTCGEHADAANLDGLAFKIGENEWADTSMVADEVQVRFRLALTGVGKL